MLQDHFHPPFSNGFGWKGLHGQWARVLVADLNERLPEGWRAESDVRFEIEVDVGVLDEQDREGSYEKPEQLTTFPPPVATIAFALNTDVVEVRVINDSYSPSLVGAIELVIPANKDRPETRQAFVSKCVSLLGQGAGLIVMDVVTTRRANLHAILLERLGEPDPDLTSSLYATAYHPTVGPGSSQGALEIWEEGVRVGAPLPTLPLYLRIGPTLGIDFNSSYVRACRELRIPLADETNGTL